VEADLYPGLPSHTKMAGQTLGRDWMMERWYYMMLVSAAGFGDPCADISP
jgi:hypothetical protein